MLIQGEQYQLLCDYSFGLQGDFFNPLIKNKKWKNIEDSYIIFCYSHRWKDFLENINIFNNNLIVILHNSDENINDNVIKKLLNTGKIIKIYSQNLCTYNDYKNVFWLPIGLQNNMWNNNIHIQNVINNIHKIEKNNNIFFNFNINTAPIKRKDCYIKVKNKGIPFIQIFNNIDEYFNTMATYKFVICPEGNGIDTHRMWEALYLKCIPICLTNDFTNKVSKIFPIILLNSWDNLLDNYEYDKIYYEYNLNLNNTISLQI